MMDAQLESIVRNSATTSRASRRAGQHVMNAAVQLSRPRASCARASGVGPCRGLPRPSPPGPTSAGVLQSDACRREQLPCHTAAEGHPYRGFTWGNRASLWDQPSAAGIAIRDRILEYYKYGSREDDHLPIPRMQPPTQPKEAESDAD